MFKTVKSALLGFAGIFGYSAEAKEEADIETAAAAPTEGNIDNAIIDSKAVIEHLDKNIPIPVVEAAAAIGISIVSFAFDPSVKGGTVIGGEILIQLPIINPKWGKITLAHGQALVQALSDIEGDFGI